LISAADLKAWIHRDLPRLDKLLLVLATLADPASISQIKDAAAASGFRIPRGWNVSDVLSRSNGLAIRIPAGWELAESGKQHLRNLGVSKLSAAAVKVAVDLRAHLKNISSDDTRSFVEEAIKCYEAELYRSAVVMSWLAAVNILYKEVVANHLSAFNAEARRIDSRWRDARNTDDLGRMGEAEFLDRIAAISVIGKNVKEELQKALKLRNGCGHPNSLRISANMTAGHLELLLLNVFDRYQH
jgi:hypothetical protein